MGGNRKEKLRRITEQGGFFCVLFVWACLLFGWPLVCLTREGPGLFVQLFLSALAVVLVLLAVAWARSGSRRTGG